MESTQSKIEDIRQQCRLAMNGMAANAMSERGIRYKLNYGVEYPRIREIALRHAPDHALASELWQSGVREMQIMAGIIQPPDSFPPEMADEWMGSIGNCELAEMTSMNLFSRLTYAAASALKWIAQDGEFAQYCGYLTLARLLARGTELNERATQELIDQASAAALSEATWPRQGAINALAALSRQSKENSRLVMDVARRYASSQKPLEREFYTQITYSAL